VDEPLAFLRSRVVDGWDAENFMQTMKPLIEDPSRLLS
jgi:pyruvate/2-oxoglutarate dehydrogenase complex dihydrolipoamide acyltransferase (E2) component